MREANPFTFISPKASQLPTVQKSGLRSEAAVFSPTTTDRFPLVTSLNYSRSSKAKFSSSHGVGKNSSALMMLHTSAKRFVVPIVPEPRNLKVWIRDEWLVTRETLRLFPRTVIPSAAEGSPLQAGKRWVFDDEKREVLSLPPRTPVVISGVQERFLDFARNDDTGKALSSDL